MEKVNFNNINLSAYEAMDRIHIIQCQIQEALLEHWYYEEDAEHEFKQLLDEAIDTLGECYQIAARDWYNSIENNVVDGDN